MKQSSKLPSECLCLMIILVAVAMLIPPTVAHASRPSPASAQSVALQATPIEVLHALEVQLNAHNVSGGLALFADNASVYDPTTISCYGGTGYLCEPSELHASYSSTTQIRGWLQYLAEVNVEVQEVGAPQATGNNVTWTWQVSNDGYRDLNIAPLLGTGQALVQGNLIEYFVFRLNTSSLQTLYTALSSQSQSPFLLAAQSLGIGMVALGLVFPGVAVYYVSRVKRLFASVPKLDKPWMLLGGGIGTLFVSVVLLLLRDVTGLSAGILDSLLDVTLTVCAFLVMSSMFLMKQVMIGEPDE